MMWSKRFGWACSETMGFWQGMKRCFVSWEEDTMFVIGNLFGWFGEFEGSARESRGSTGDAKPC